MRNYSRVAENTESPDINQRLLQYCNRGNYHPDYPVYYYREEIKYFLRKGADINTQNSEGATPLYITVSCGKLGITETLLEFDPIINLANKDGFTPLHVAADKGNLKIVKVLLNKALKAKANSSFFPLFKSFLCLPSTHQPTQEKFNIDIPRNDGYTALHLAVQKGCIEIVNFLLEKGANINVITNNGFTLLHCAALETYHNKVELIELLLERGLNINASDNKGHTPLHFAAFNGYSEVVRCLLDKGANINAPNNDGWTPLYIAIDKKHPNVIKLLLERGADVNIKDKCQVTPLHYIARSDQRFGDKIAEMVMDLGADIEAVTIDGCTSLYLAAVKGDTGLLAKLLERGANTEIADEAGWTPLHIATVNNHFGAVNLLLERGANIGTSTKNGWTPLYTAAHKGHIDIVKLLLDKGANVNDKGPNVNAVLPDEWTPLMTAAKHGHIRVVKLLLERGAKVEVTTKDGITPLHFAAYFNHNEIVKLLLAHGAKVEVTTKDEITPLHFAAYFNHNEIVKLLLAHGAIVSDGMIESLTSHTSILLPHLKNVKYIQQIATYIKAGTGINNLIVDEAVIDDNISIPLAKIFADVFSIIAFKAQILFHDLRKDQALTFLQHNVAHTEENQTFLDPLVRDLNSDVEYLVGEIRSDQTRRDGFIANLMQALNSDLLTKEQASTIRGYLQEYPEVVRAVKADEAAAEAFYRQERTSINKIAAQAAAMPTDDYPDDLDPCSTEQDGIRPIEYHY
jgi:ankyrin repeat protein